MNMIHEKSRHIIAAIFAATFAGTSMAANYWWTGAEDRLFGNVNNWRKDNATTGSVPTTIPASDAVRFMAMSGSTSVFDDRFKNDDYIVEFDKAYTNTWQLYVNTGGAKLTWQGTGSNPSYTFTRPAYNTSVVMGIGDTTDSTIRIEDMVYVHSYTNLVLGWTNGKKGNLEIGSGATVSIPSTAVCCDGLWMRYGSSLLIAGGTLDCGKNIRIGVAANSLAAGKNVISNLNGTVTASWFGVGCKNTHGEYIQKGGSLSTTDHIFITHDWTKGSGYFEVDGGEVIDRWRITSHSRLSAAISTSSMITPNNRLIPSENSPGSQPTEIMAVLLLARAASFTALKCSGMRACVSKLSMTLKYFAYSGVCTGRSVALPPHNTRTSILSVQFRISLTDKTGTFSV